MSKSKKGPPRAPRAPKARRGHTVESTRAPIDGEQARKKTQEQLAKLRQVQALDDAIGGARGMPAAERQAFEAALADLRLDEARWMLTDRSPSGAVVSIDDCFASEAPAEELPPRPRVGAVWRYRDRDPVAEKGVRIVRNDGEPCSRERAEALASLSCARTTDFSMETGELIGVSGNIITLDAARARDLVLVVFDGEITVSVPQQGEAVTVKAEKDLLRACHMSCAGRFGEEIVVTVTGDRVKGVWAMAGALQQRDRGSAAPVGAVHVRTTSAPFGPRSGVAAKELRLAPDNSDYRHFTALEAGLFGRYELDWEQKKLDTEIEESAELHVLGPPARERTGEPYARRYVLDHHPALELFIVLAGGFWIMHQDASRLPSNRVFTVQPFTDGGRGQEYDTDLVTASHLPHFPGDVPHFSGDVMLMDSSYNHLVASLDSTPSACLHISFLTDAGAGAIAKPLLQPDLNVSSEPNVVTLRPSKT